MNMAPPTSYAPAVLSQTPGLPNICDAYQQAAARTESGHDVNPQDVRLRHAVYGLVTESGELLDALKRHDFYGAPIDLTNIREELGDLLWYIALACNANNWRLSEVMQANINKLYVRYPDKFRPEEALQRQLEIERFILEQSVNSHLLKEQTLESSKHEGQPM